MKTENIPWAVSVGTVGMTNTATKNRNHGEGECVVTEREQGCRDRVNNVLSKMF